MSESESLRRRPENAIDAADVIDGVLILKRNDGRELRVAAGEAGGPGGGSSLTTVQVDGDRNLQPEDIGCLLIGSLDSSIQINATNLDEFNDGDIFYASMINVSGPWYSTPGVDFQSFVVVDYGPVFGKLLLVGDNQYPPDPTQLSDSRSDGSSATVQTYVEGGGNAQASTSVINAIGASGMTYSTLSWDNSAKVQQRVENQNGATMFKGSVAVNGDSWVALIAGPKVAEPGNPPPLVSGKFEGGVQKLGFFGAAEVPKPAHPTTIEEVIAGLTALGLFQ